jgi:hypothetical protein
MSIFLSSFDRKIIPKNHNKYKQYHINIQRGGVSESRYDEDYTGADIFAGRTGESEDRLRAGGNRLRR